MVDSIVEKVQEISRDGGKLSDKLKAAEKDIADYERKIVDLDHSNYTEESMRLYHEMRMQGMAGLATPFRKFSW